MGTRNRSRFDKSALYFVTTTFLDWHRRLATSEMRTWFEELLFEVSERKASALMGYLVMESHIHLFAGCRGGGSQLSEYMRSLKSLSSRFLFREAAVWMPRFDDLIINSEHQFKIKLNYIHNSPILSGHVANALDWKWSNAGFWLLDEPKGCLTKTWEWLSGEDT
ncbi:MAG: hypothetical protein FJY67_09105 [Calditrichaeota bacterium]|nr:hypothetical protein [Calditrichota bacterium]